MGSVKRNDHGYEIVEVQKDYIDNLEENTKLMERLLQKQKIYLSRIKEDIEGSVNNGRTDKESYG